MNTTRSSLSIIIISAATIISAQSLSAQSNIQLPPEIARMLPPGMTLVPDERPLSFDKYDKIGDSQQEFLYYYVKEDPVSEVILDEPMMLQVGDKISKFQSYGGYMSDSIAYTHKMSKEPISFHEWQIKLYGTTDSNDDIYRWHEKNDSITFYGSISSLGRYYYDEPEPDYNWVLTDETKQIGPYICHKATASIYGREWEAWFTEDVPVSEGPWKLAGLPGIIVNAYDIKHEHTFKLTSIRDAKLPIIFNSESSYGKTDRLKFNKRLKAHIEKPLQVYEGTDMMPTDLAGNPMEAPKEIKRFNNYIEKE